MTKFKYIGETDISSGEVRTYEGKCIPASGLIEFDQEFFIEKARKNANYEEVKDAAQKVKEEIGKSTEDRDDGEEIRQRAKELGIKSYWNKKIDKLIQEIEGLESKEND